MTLEITRSGYRLSPLYRPLDVPMEGLGSHWLTGLRTILLCLENARKRRRESCWPACTACTTPAPRSLDYLTQKVKRSIRNFALNPYNSRNPPDVPM